MVWLAWAAVIVFILLLEWIAWRIAEKLDSAERQVQEWERFLFLLEQSDPQQAAYLRWMREQQS